MIQYKTNQNTKQDNSSKQLLATQKTINKQERVSEFPENNLGKDLETSLS